MIKRLSAFLIMCIMPGIALCSIGGSTDNREVIGWIYDKPDYVDANTKNNWNTSPYDNIVLVVIEEQKNALETNVFTGTGSFISPRHILTNTHVADGCGRGKKKPCKIITSSGDTFTAKVVFDGGKINTTSTSEYKKDWSVLEIRDTTFCKKTYFDYMAKSPEKEMLWRAGFGGLRVLSDTDVKNIRTAYLALVTELVNKSEDVKSQEKQELIDSAMEEGVKHGRIMNSKVFMDTYKKLSGKDFIEDCLADTYTLKKIDNCSIEYIQDGMGSHSCQSWYGDSGSALLRKSDNKVALLHKGGLTYITSKDSFLGGGVANENIFTPDVIKAINDVKHECTTLPVFPKPVETPRPAPSMELPTVATTPDTPASGQKPETPAPVASDTPSVETPVASNENPPVVNTPATTLKTSEPIVTSTIKSNPIVAETSVFDRINSFLEYDFDGDAKKVNMARIASDSVAGIVLGTVGGVVTSKIIQNTQRKSGFDDLKCTIGDRAVATYGDVFNVGMQ